MRRSNPFPPNAAILLHDYAMNPILRGKVQIPSGSDGGGQDRDEQKTDEEEGRE